MEQQPLKNGTQQRAKHWCLTINNYGDADICQFENIKESATYFVYGKEVGDSGTRHLQCYISFKTAKYRNAVARIWPTAFIEMSLGTPQQASDYCKKDGKYEEFGTLPVNGRAKGGESTKAKWAEIAKFAVEKNLVQIQESHPREFVSNYRNLKQIGFDFAQKPADLASPCGIWMYGEAGVGKSFTSRKENPGAFMKMMNKWWDNYNNEDVVILEDMDPSYAQSMQYFLKIWTDAYAFPVEIKNHSVMIRPKKFIITSQYTPEEIWQDKKIIEAIRRRCVFRNVIRIEENDTSEVMKKPKRKLSSQKILSEKKPRLFKQNANGDIVVNDKPVIQKPLEFKPNTGGYFSFEEYPCSQKGYCLKCQKVPCECVIHISVESSSESEDSEDSEESEESEVDTYSGEDSSFADSDSY